MAKRRATPSSVRARRPAAILGPARAAAATDAPARAPLTEEERRRFEGYVAEVFARLGLKLDSPGTKETPRRHLQALWDLTVGYEGKRPLRHTRRCWGSSAISTAAGWTPR